MSDKLLKRLKKTLTEVSKLLSISPSEISRNVYIRIAVDTDIQGRLNKEELGDIGGYTAARDELFPSIQEKKDGPKVLIYDIETSPIEAYVWGLWDNNVGLNQIIKDWEVLSWAAKWLGASEDSVMYMDQREGTCPKNEKEVLEGIWELLNECDIVITQNGKKFDQKKLNARFFAHKMRPPSSYRHIDTLKIAKRVFGFTSNKLAYMTDKFCTKYKKLKHGKFPGQSMWTQCLAGNQEAWEEMEVYNKYDVLSLEELYLKMAAWDNSVNFNCYHDEDYNRCKCGNSEFEKSGFHYSNAGKYQKMKCTDCGHETRKTENLLDKYKRKRMRRDLSPSH